MNKGDIIVVEGKNDKAKILEIYNDANVIITNGSEIPESTLKMIEELSKTNNIILFLDPDYPGERIRSIITNVVPDAKQAFIKKKLAIDERKHKVGIEHATREDIIESLSNLLSSSNKTSDITVNDLYELGLLGSNNSGILREKIAGELSIGNPNGKTFLKRLNMLGMSLEELRKIING